MALSEPAAAPGEAAPSLRAKHGDHAVPLGDRHRYINRHLSWLDFDTRVLELAEDTSRALLERAKFLAISSSNLDEFFQVRGILAAMVSRDVLQARRIAAGDDRVDRIYHRLFDDLIQMMTEDNTTVFRATNLVFIAHHLERIADRVTNIAEDLVFLDSGAIEELG